MAQTIANPLNGSRFIDVTESFETVAYPYGAFSKTGLYTVEPVTQRTVIADVTMTDYGKMSGFNSVRERDADRTAKTVQKAVTFAIPHMKLVESITYENFEGRVANFNGLTDAERAITINDETLDRLERMSLTMTQNHEYMAVEAAKGVLRDPRDGTAYLDMVANLGVVRLTETLNLASPTLDILAWAVALKTKIQRANKVSPVVPVVDIVVTNADLQAISTHASIAPLRANLITGTGRAGLALAQDLLYSETSLTAHGVSQVFDLGNGVRFITYPNVFTRQDGTNVEVTTNGKGFTVLRGVRGLYKAVAAPAPYFSQLGAKGSETYAWRTPIQHDQHFEVGLESSVAYYMTQPELSVDVTITK